MTYVDLFFTDTVVLSTLEPAGSIKVRSTGLSSVDRHYCKKITNHVQLHTADSVFQYQLCYM